MIPENNEPALQQAAPVAASRIWQLNGTFPVFVDLLVLFGIYLLVSLAVGFVFGLFGMLPVTASLLESGDAAVRHAAQITEGHFIAVNYILSMGLTVAGFVWYRRARHATGRMARFAKRGLNPLLLLWGLLFIFATAIVIEPLFALLPDVPEDIYGRGGWLFLTLVVAAPLLEEFLCRGVLLESLRAKYGTVTAVFLSALCFGLLHGVSALIVNALVIGLIFGFLYVRSGSLWTTIILHACNNALAYWTMSRGIGSLSDAVGTQWLYWTIYILAAVIFLFSGYKTVRTLKALDAQDKNRAAV